MAQPLFDAGTGAGASSTSLTTALTIAANSNRVLYVFINDLTQTGVTSVVWNTTESLTQIASGTFNTAGDNWFLYRLINPTATTANVVSTFPGAAAAHSHLLASYYDTDQTTPNDTEDEAEGSGTAAQNTVTSATGDTCLAFIAVAGSSTLAPASGETERVDTGGTTALYELAGGASLSFDITLGTSRAWVVVGLNLNAVAAGVTTRRYSLPLTGVG